MASLVPDQISILERLAAGIGSTMESQIKAVGQDPSFKNKKPQQGRPGNEDNSGGLGGSTHLPSILRGLWLRLWPATVFPLQ
jgi:hypothetical protein